MIGRFSLFAPLFAAAAGCMTESRYLEDRAALDCQIAELCDDAVACESQDFDLGSCHRFQGAEASRCIEALEDAVVQLEEQGPPEGGCLDLRYPPECDEVYARRGTPPCNAVEGRPLVDHGMILLPRWTDAGPLAADVPDAAAVAAGRRWLHAARTELASVPAFARLSIELLHLGAPSWLVARAIEAAGDEVRHARACLDVARGLSGRDLRLGAIASAAPRPIDLRRLAVEALREGCVGEGTAAVRAAVAIAGAPASIASTLRVIARDETAHAALGWATVGWALRADPSLGSVLFRELVLVRGELAADAAAPAAEGGAQLRLYGVLDAPAAAALAIELVDVVVAPALARLVAQTAGSRRAASTVARGDDPPQ
jgi:hypothetical protein